MNEDKCCGTCGRFVPPKTKFSRIGECPLKPGEPMDPDDMVGCMAWKERDIDPEYCFDCRTPCRKGVGGE